MPQALPQAYDGGIVGLSMLVAIFAAYTALDLAGRVHATSGRARVLWLTCGSAALGAGLWSMHFVGMLARTLSIPLSYSAPAIAASVAFAVASSLLALWASGREEIHGGVMF